MHAFPLHFCPVRKQYVELDQTRPGCAAEHGCALDKCCLPDRFFAASKTDATSTGEDSAPATREQV